MGFRKAFVGELKRNVSRQQLRKKLRQASAESTGAVVKADNGIDDFVMKNGFLYTVVRAITARVNQNYDGWPPDELRVAAHTFVGKPVFVNHQNSDPKKARGRVVAARYFENGADKGIECIMEVDAARFPKLAHEIRTGGLDSVSMGAEAGFTICSMCGNKATDTKDMCDHVRFHKGEHLMKNGSAQLVYESCYKLGFFELSYVFDPADETAVVSKVIQASTTKSANPREAIVGMIKQAYGEVEAPESVDTLRQEEPGSEEDFHSYVETPKELRDPNLDRTQQLDREQEAEGLDQGRNVEDVEGWEAPDHALNEQQAQQQGQQRPEEEFLMAMLTYSAPVNGGGSGMNEGRTREDNTMGRSRNSLASRGKVAANGNQRHRKQAEGPLTDGGDQSVNAQSTREPDENEFITQTPSTEEVDLGDTPGGISNTENTLVARMQHTQQQLLRDAARYQELQASKGRRTATEVQDPGMTPGGGLQAPAAPTPPPAVGGGLAGNANGALVASRQQRIAHKISWMEQRLGRKLTADESATVATSVPETADVVNPALSGTDDQSLKGSDFQPADPNSGVQQTQPQDSRQSAKIWAAFDNYLAQGTGRTARQHGIGQAKNILREAKKFANANGLHEDAYFPHLGNVLSQMKTDEMQRRANMQRRADTSLDLAAPGGRIDVEAPTSNTTDAGAQASQFAIDEFGRNAGDGIADPDLSTDYVTWAPGEGKKEGFKRASAALAVRAADLFVEAGLRAPEERYNLIAQHEVMRAGQVADRIAMCEAFIDVRQRDAQHSASRQRLAASGVSRGAARQVPPGFGNGTLAPRTASRRISALEDQSTDGLMFM